MNTAYIRTYTETIPSGCICRWTISYCETSGWILRSRSIHCLIHGAS